MIRCLITAGTAPQNEQEWLDHISAWIAAGIELIQIREPSLSARELCDLARRVMLLPNPYGTKVLVNDRADVAVASGAHGVHLKDGSVFPELFARPGFLVSAACHRISEVNQMRGANFIVLAPIFDPLSKEKSGPALGVEAISELARMTSIPILALGGITAAGLCVVGGAAGFAGISCFSKLPGGSGPSSLLL
jgi:thiamine-phosphate pyrophosphorylase